MILTSDNYYSLEANREYMSCSQYQGFCECEAKAMACLNGEWIEPKETPLLVGSYLHSHFEGPEAKQRFIAEHPEMFLKSGGLKAEYKKADEMIATLEADEFCMYMLQGQPEVILTAELFGIPWKVRYDKYLPGKRRITDIKTTRSIRGHEWKEIGGRNEKVSFVEMYDYMMRSAVYCEIERITAGREPGDWPDFYIVAVSKEDPPDKTVINLSDPYRFAEELEHVREGLLRIKLIRQGALKPIRCEKCNYCRSTKTVEKVISYKDL